MKQAHEQQATKQRKPKESQGKDLSVVISRLEEAIDMIVLDTLPLLEARARDIRSVCRIARKLSAELKEQLAAEG